MEYFWTGTWPEQMAPRVTDLAIAGKGGRFDNVRLERHGEYVLQLNVDHANNSSLSVRAEIMPEPVQLSDGGDYEPRPPSIEGLVLTAGLSGISFRAPEEPGAYRILVFVTDDNHFAGTANIPFFVE